MIDFTGLSRPYFHRLYRREMNAAGNLEVCQRALLSDLLRCGGATAYGTQYHFGEIVDYETFAGQVPIAGYDKLRPWVMRMVNGEADVLWPGVCRNFAQSSGTSDGKSKFIPVTGRSLKRCHYAGAAFSMASYLENYSESRIFGGKNFILGGSFANELKLPAGVKVGDLSATLIDRINPLVNLFRVPDKKTALLEDWQEKLPRLVDAALKADLRSLSGVPSWFLTLLKKALDVTGKDSIMELWPNLEVFFHGGIAFGPYREQYARITGPRGIRYWENYNASEGFFGVQARKADDAMHLLVDNDVFYEFISVDDPDSAPVPAWKVREGEIYAMVITSSNGLWRYPVGDTVKIRSTRPLEITIAGRTRHFINAFGEEVMVFNTDAALARTCHETGAEVLNYTAAPVFAGDHTRGRHEWLIEFSQAPADLKAFAERLDRNLQAENSDYQAKRSGGIFLDCLTVVAARPGLFDSWLASTGKLGGQRKVPRLSNDRCFIDPMLEMNRS